ncbi:M15 family metallopeptidase [Streptomyces sp. NPDC127033]|uniref:M15 family metallopeptidase n=1 Tax=Streptomyces sp. NPDC127033 TaxID=3347110 RepID=UPI00365A21FB
MTSRRTVPVRDATEHHARPAPHRRIPSVRGGGRRRALPGRALSAACLLLATACATGTETTEGGPRAGESRTASPSPSPSANPVVKEIPAEQWQRITETGTWREGCPVTREDLRRVEVNYVDFEGGTRRGVLVVNADIAESISRVFTRLFDERFPINRMQPVEAYDGDTKASLEDNNTAAYNCRRLDQINAPVRESPHANGRAIDINPLQNPWKDLRCRCWSPSAEYAERTPGKGAILDGGLVWRTFVDEGWIWQNIKVPDYMHFDAGYPSVPVTGGRPSPTTSAAPPPDYPLSDASPSPSDQPAAGRADSGGPDN